MHVFLSLDTSVFEDTDTQRIRRSVQLRKVTVDHWVLQVELESFRKPAFFM